MLTTQWMFGLQMVELSWSFGTREIWVQTCALSLVSFLNLGSLHEAPIFVCKYGLVITSSENAMNNISPWLARSLHPSVVISMLKVTVFFKPMNSRNNVSVWNREGKLIFSLIPLVSYSYVFLYIQAFLIILVEFRSFLFFWVYYIQNSFYKKK